MTLKFNMVLREAGLEPSEVRLMRHQHVAKDGLTPFILWRDNRAEFERYQSAQRTDRRAHFASRYWAGFVVPPDGSTMFAGMYEIFGHTPVPVAWVDPLMRQANRSLHRPEASCCCLTKRNRSAWGFTLVRMRWVASGHNHFGPASIRTCSTLSMSASRSASVGGRP